MAGLGSPTAAEEPLWLTERKGAVSAGGGGPAGWEPLTLEEGSVVTKIRLAGLFPNKRH